MNEENKNVNTTIHETTEAYINHLKQEGKKERTLYTYRKDLDLVEDYFGKDRKLHEISLPHVGKFFKSDMLLKLKNGNLKSEITVKKTVRVFRMMMVWAKDNGMLEVLPLPKSTSMGHSIVNEDDAPEESFPSENNQDEHHHDNTSETPEENQESHNE